MWLCDILHYFRHNRRHNIERMLCYSIDFIGEISISKWISHPYVYRLLHAVKHCVSCEMNILPPREEKSLVINPRGNHHTFHHSP